MVLVERLPRLVELTFASTVLTFSRVLLPICIIGGCTTEQVRLGAKLAKIQMPSPDPSFSGLPLFFFLSPRVGFFGGGPWVIFFLFDSFSFFVEVFAFAHVPRMGQAPKCSVAAAGTNGNPKKSLVAAPPSRKGSKRSQLL